MRRLTRALVGIALLALLAVAILVPNTSPKGGPAVADVLYTAGPNGQVAQLDAATGSINWSKTVFGAGDQGLRVAVGTDGRVAFGTDTGSVAVLDVNGNTLWSQAGIMGTAQAVDVAIMADNSVLALGGPGVGASTYTARLLDAADGHEVTAWVSPNASSFGALGMDPTGAYIVVGDSFGAVYRLDISAGVITQAWGIYLPASDWVDDIIVTSTAVYILGYDGQNIYKLDPATGSVTWTYNANTATGSTVLLSRMALMSDGTIRYAQADGHWYWIKADGTYGGDLGLLPAGYTNTPAGAGSYGEFDGVYGAVVDASDTLYWGMEQDDSGTPAAAVRAYAAGSITWTTTVWPPGTSGSFADTPHGLALYAPTTPTRQAAGDRVRSSVSENAGSVLDATTLLQSDASIGEDFPPGSALTTDTLKEFVEAFDPATTTMLYYPAPTQNTEHLDTYQGSTKLGRMAATYPPALLARMQDISALSAHLVGGTKVAAQHAIEYLFSTWASLYSWFAYETVPDLRYAVPGLSSPSAYGATDGLLYIEAFLLPQETDTKLSMKDITEQFLSAFPGTVLRQNSAGNIQLVPVVGPAADASPVVTLANDDVYLVSDGAPDPRGVINRATFTAQGYSYQDDQAVMDSAWAQITSRQLFGVGLNTTLSAAATAGASSVSLASVTLGQGGLSGAPSLDTSMVLIIAGTTYSITSVAGTTVGISPTLAADAASGAPVQSWGKLLTPPANRSPSVNRIDISGADQTTLTTASAFQENYPQEWMKLTTALLGSSYLRLTDSGGTPQLTAELKYVHYFDGATGYYPAGDAGTLVNVYEVPFDGDWHTCAFIRKSVNAGTDLVYVYLSGRWVGDGLELKITGAQLETGMALINVAAYWCIGINFDSSEKAFAKDSGKTTGTFGSSGDTLPASDGSDLVATSQAAYGVVEKTVNITAYEATADQLEQMARAYVMRNISPVLIRQVTQSVWRAFPVAFDHIGHLVQLPDGEQGIVEARTYADDFGSSYGDGRMDSSVRVRVTDTSQAHLDTTTSFLLSDDGGYFKLDDGSISEPA